MKKKKKTVRRTQELVLGHLEKISSKIFSDYSKELTELADKRHGVYALYKGSRLYYVGLATNLKNRIKVHLKDRHSGKWDKFSLYLVRKADHIKELEALILRIADPAGNATKGRLRHAENLRKKLKERIKTTQEVQLTGLLGVAHTKSSKKRQARNKADPSLPLSPYVHKRFRIRAYYKGETYSAGVRKDGRIYYNGEIYDSPSAAAKAIVDRRGVNGWRFWLYKNKQGEWVSLNRLKR